MGVMELSTFLGAISGIAVFVVGAYKVMKIITSIENKLDDIPKIREEINAMNKEIRDVKEELEENSIETCRLVITNEAMPLEERVEAGRKYVEKYHANGGVKLLYEELKIQQAEEEYNKLRPPNLSKDKL